MMHFVFLWIHKVNLRVHQQFLTKQISVKFFSLCAKTIQLIQKQFHVNPESIIPTANSSDIQKYYHEELSLLLLFKSEH